jgi:hypothetical protein
MMKRKMMICNHSHRSPPGWKGNRQAIKPRIIANPERIKTRPITGLIWLLKMINPANDTSNPRAGGV